MKQFVCFWPGLSDKIQIFRNMSTGSLGDILNGLEIENRLIPSEFSCQRAMTQYRLVTTHAVVPYKTLNFSPSSLQINFFMFTKILLSFRLRSKKFSPYRHLSPKSTHRKKIFLPQNSRLLNLDHGLYGIKRPLATQDIRQPATVVREGLGCIKAGNVLPSLGRNQCFPAL